MSENRGVTWIEIIGATGVVFSLIFVGWQVHQNTEAIKIAAYLQVQEGANQLNLSSATNPDLNRAIQAWRGDNFTDTLDARVYSFGIAILRNIEDAHYMTLQGVYEPDQLNRLTANPIFASPRFPAMWQRARKRFSPRFQAFVDSIERSRE